MLARPDHRCVECGLAYGAASFHYHQGKPRNGAAYWSDRGLLCSPACSLAYFRKRQADGTLPSSPAANPMPGFEPPGD